MFQYQYSSSHVRILETLAHLWVFLNSFEVDTWDWLILLAQIIDLFHLLLYLNINYFILQNILIGKTNHKSKIETKI